MRPTFCLSFFLDLLLSFFSSFFHSFLSTRISSYIEYHQKLSNLRNVSFPSTFSFTFEFIESISLFLFLGLSLKFFFVPSTRRFSQSEYSYSRLERSEQCIRIFLLFSFFSFHRFLFLYLLFVRNVVASGSLVTTSRSSFAKTREISFESISFDTIRAPFPTYFSNSLSTWSSRARAMIRTRPCPSQM